jgi:hypothetical protein
LQRTWQFFGNLGKPSFGAQRYARTRLSIGVISRAWSQVGGWKKK